MSILFQDETIVVLEKPAPFPSLSEKPGQKNQKSLQGWLDRKIPGAKLVHRLDNETSGLMVAAKTEAIYEKLRALWNTSAVTKKYSALVVGKTPHTGKITIPIAHHPKKKKKMLVGGKKGRPAITYFTTLSSDKNYTLLKVEIKSGVRHQIRAHLAFLGHPIVGDKVYGKPTKERHFLHLSFLEFPHPITQKKMRWKSPLPKDLKTLLSTLVKNARP